MCVCVCMGNIETGLNAIISHVLPESIDEDHLQWLHIMSKYWTDLPSKLMKLAYSTSKYGKGCLPYES